MNKQPDTQPRTRPAPNPVHSDVRYVCIPVLSDSTSVSIKREVYNEALRLAGGCSVRMYAVVREAALELALSDAKRKAAAAAGTPTEPNQKCSTFSARVRIRALAKLRGAYRPTAISKANDSPTPFEVALAVENNKAWSV